MDRFWRTADGMKQLAVALLLLAIAAIAVVHTAGQKMVAIQGPGALQAIDDRSVWLGVNEELWILDAKGRRTAQRTSAQLGLTEAVSNIALAPDGQAVVTSRGDKTWQVVNRADLARVRTITPQWPEKFRDTYLRAVHLAVSPEWDIAVATGGGHTVLLFDRDGKFKTQTAPNTYYFTNGLWHSPQGWWTTDTNRSALRLLDTKTLVVRETVALKGPFGGYSALGELVPSRGQPAPGTRELPVATVSRLGFLMEPGFVADVFPDGRHAAFNHAPLAQLRDIAWFGDTLLAVDGGAYQVLRFAADRTSLEPFGDAAVRAMLAQMRADRAFWSELSSRYMFILAALLLLGGIGAYGRHRKLAVQAVTAPRQGQVIGTDRQAAAQLLRQRLWIFGLPVVLRLSAALLGLLVLYPWLKGLVLVLPGNKALLSLNLLVWSVLLPVLLVAIWQLRRHERLAASARYETTLNHKALVWLDQHDDWDSVRRNGETPRETLFLPGWKPRWLLVTNQRVLLFAASARERRLQREWPRGALTFAGRLQDEPGARPPALWRRLLLASPNLVLRFDGVERLMLRGASSVTTSRIAALLMQGRPARPRSATSSAPVRASVRPARRWHEVLASFVVPGLGQWLQDRFVTGTVLFTAGVLLCLVGWGPVMWASSGPKMHVDLTQKAFALALWLAFALVAAADAFHFSATRKHKR